METLPSLLCRVHGRLAALPLSHVIEVMRPQPVNVLPEAPPFVLGVSLIRGVPTPVIDLGALLGPDGATAPTRFVTVRAAARYVSLAVDEVSGIHHLPAAPMELSPLIREASAGVISTIRAVDQDLLLVLETALLVPESVWAVLEGVTT